MLPPYMRLIRALSGTSTRSGSRLVAWRRMGAETLERRELLAGDCEVFYNEVEPADVDRNSIVTPRDALLPINHLIKVNNLPEGNMVCPRTDFAFDVNNDGEVSPIDALRVINRLADPDGSGDPLAMLIDRIEAYFVTLESTNIKVEFFDDAVIGELVLSADVVSGDAEIELDFESSSITVNRAVSDVASVRVVARGPAGIDERVVDIDFRKHDQQAPLTIDLASGNDSGRSATDDITSYRRWDLQIENVAPFQTVRILANDTVLKEQFVTRADSVLTVSATELTDGDYAVSIETGDLPGGDRVAGPVITLDSIAPPSLAIHNAVSIVYGEQATLEFENEEDDVRVECFNFHSECTPTDTGIRLIVSERNPVARNFDLAITSTDVAGNASVHQLEVEVLNNPDPRVQLSDKLLFDALVVAVDEGEASQRLLAEFDYATAALVPQDALDIPLPAVDSAGGVFSSVLTSKDIADAVGYVSPLPVDTFEDLPLPTNSAIALPTSTTVDNAYSSDLAVSSVYVVNGNPRLLVKVQDYGEMIFEIFDSHVPNLAEHLTQLVETGYFDGQRLFAGSDNFVHAGTHGVKSEFVEDEYHPHLRHTRAGALSFAKFAEDTFDTEWFVTSGPNPSYDFNYSMVGQIVAGDEVRQAIESALQNPTSSAPILIESARIVRSENFSSVFVVTDEETGVSNITIEQALNVEKSFELTVEENAAPFFLSPVEDFRFATGVGKVDFDAIDIDGDPVQFSVNISNEVDAEVSIDSNGVVDIVPARGYEGTIEIEILVSITDNDAEPSDRRQFSAEISRDANGDQIFTVGDIDHVCRQAANLPSLFSNALDHLGVLAGDVNLDGVFDSSDLITLFAAAEYEDTLSGNSVWSTGDFSCDGEFDSADLTHVFKGNTYTNR